MEFKNVLVLLVALAVAALSVANVSAFGSISSIEVSGVDALHGANIATFAGQTLPVRVVFSADGNATDVRIKAWISGEKEYAVVSERFDVIADGIYSRLLSVKVPANTDPSEPLKLEVLVESANGEISVQETVNLNVQRESYKLEILDVIMDSEAKAGALLSVDIVLKNRGSHLSDDTFVKVTIPALGIEKKGYFGDLSPVDQANPDKEDATEGRLYLSIPSNAQSGVYLVEIEAYNADSDATMSKKVAIDGTSSAASPTSTDNKGTINTQGKGFTANTAVILTVVLAVIFVVLLVVLIVLLTRKPEKTEEFGESYY